MRHVSTYQATGSSLRVRGEEVEDNVDAESKVDENLECERDTTHFHNLVEADP